MPYSIEARVRPQRDTKDEYRHRYFVDLRSRSQDLSIQFYYLGMTGMQELMDACYPILYAAEVESEP